MKKPPSGTAKSLLLHHALPHETYIRLELCGVDLKSTHLHKPWTILDSLDALNYA